MSVGLGYRWTGLCALVGGLLLACGGGDHAKGKEPSADGGGGPSVTKEGPPKRTPVTAAKLAPTIYETGTTGVVPDSIVVELAAPIVDSGRVGEASAKSQLKLTPELGGTLTYTRASTMTFTPERPFAFGTHYKAELVQLETRDGVMAPPEDQGWVREFDTPAFAFLRWAPMQVDLGKKPRLGLDLVFSGAVLAAKAKPFLTVTIDGKPTANVVLSPATNKNVLEAVVTDPRIVLGAKVRLAVKKGLPAEADATAEAASAEYVVSNEHPLDIKNAVVREGTQGSYIEIICDDQAATGPSRYYYDEQTGDSYSDLSARCELVAEAASRIKFKPAVKKVYVTGGTNGFRIFGDFKRGTYAMTIPAGVTTVDGGVLLGEYEKSISIAARKPQLSFVANGRYLPRSAWKELGVRHLNVEEVNLSVRRVPPENLIFWLGDESSDRADERTSDLILAKTLPLRAEADAQATTWIDVAALLPAETRGVLELGLAGADSRATARLLVTNLSLVAKKSAPADEPWKQQVHAWALDIDTGALLDGVDLTLVKKSGKVAARCTTNGAKGCVLTAAPSADDPDQAAPFAIIARKGDDLTYIRYKDLRADVADSSVSGEPFHAENPYRAALWSDRGVYRPGDIAHVAAVVRDGRGIAPNAALPVEVRLIDPRAKIARKLALKTNPAGLLSADFPFAAFADTGHYKVELAVADKAIASYGLLVEEFVPERMKVTTAAQKPDLLLGEEAAFALEARYLFGGTATGSAVELTCSVEPSRFEPDENGELTYGVEPKGKPVVLGQAQAALDDDGHATVACPAFEGSTAFTQTGQLIANAAVMEAGSGRATVKTGRATLHPEAYYLGLKTGAERATAGRPISVTGLVVDWKGKPQAAAVKSVTVEYLHLEAEYGYYRYRDSGEEDEAGYDRYLHAVPEGKTQVAVKDGRFSFEVTPAEAGVGYMIRVTAGKATTELKLEGDFGYDYWDEGQGERVDQTPRPAKPTRLALELPKEVQVGQPLAVKLRAPYRGKVLFTVETDHVVAHEWRDTDGGALEWSWTPVEYAPNVYVSAFLVKDPHAESKEAFMPDRAYGVASARITPTEFTQTVKLDAPKEIRSASTLTVKLEAAAGDGPTYATIAVVDEGILSLTDFATPDPLAVLTAKRALGVETYETIGWTLLHNPPGPSSKSGGGDEEEGGDGKGAGRVQPVKPVAFFAGPIKLDDAGRATVPFALPSYRGQLRVMAVTISPKRIGRAEAQVTVKDPLVVQVTFPRFVTQDDELQIPVFLTNLSGAPLEVSVKLAAEVLPVEGVLMPAKAPAPLAFLGKDYGTVKLAAGAAETVVFQAKAQTPIGAAKLRVAAHGEGPAGKFDAKDELDVPFLPSGPKERIVQKIKVEGTTEVATLLKGWLPTSETSSLWLTSNPYGESFDHLKYLVHYPHGCVEQTTSSARPLLVVSNLVQQFDPGIGAARIEDMVMAGVNRLFAMQTPSGGLGYWPGATEPLEWATAYATHFLLDAKKLGYPVPEDRLKQIVDWMDDRVGRYERGGSVHHQRGNHYDDEAEAYLHYDLALAGRAKKARLVKLVAALPPNPTGQDAEDAYLLKAALYLAGDRRYEKDLKNPDASLITAERVNGWSFYSDQRRRGLMLSTFVDLFGADPAGEPLAQRVAAGLTGHPSYYYNTQELVWGVTGLGKWVGDTPKSFKAGKLLADGKALEPRPPRAKSSDRAWAVARASEYQTLTLDMPEAPHGDVFLVISSEGVRAKPEAKYGGNGLAVSRTYRTLAGEEVTTGDGSVKLGDLIFVELQLDNTSAEPIANIALVDRLPAGFEIENPHLGRGVNAEWIEADKQWTVDYLDLRDDRLNAFGKLGPKESKKLVYTVRAVTSGKFTIPSVEAEAMYDPNLWARAQGGALVVTGPWAGHLL